MGVRRQYLALLRDRLRTFDLAFLARAGLRLLATPVGTALGRPLGGPVFATSVVNYRCNLRCAFCRAWRSADGPRPGRLLSAVERAEVYRDMRRIGALGVGFTGGEPLLHEGILGDLRAARGAGLVTHLNTNGTLVTPAVAGELVRVGLESVNVSVDGADAEEHDRIRGRAGAFEGAAAGLAHLREARGRARKPRLTAVAVLSSGRAGRIGELLRTLGSLPVDGVGFLPEHRFGPDGAGNGGGAGDADAMVREILSARRAGLAVDNSTGYVRLFPAALAGRESPLRCHAGVAHVVVDPAGDIYPCLPWNEEGRAVGNVRETPLRAFWGSPAHRSAVELTAACRRCFWNCHTELNLLLRAGSRPWPA